MFLVAYVLNASSVTPMGTVGEYRCIGSAGHSTVARSVTGSSHSKPAVPSDADRDFCARGGRLRRNRRPGPAVRRGLAGVTAVPGHIEAPRHKPGGAGCA